MMMKISSYKDLVTSKLDTKKGFVTLALRKAKEATLYTKKAKELKEKISSHKNISDLQDDLSIRSQLIESAGISKKTESRLDNENLDNIVSEFLKEFIEPEENRFGDELVNRYLLTQGDALGGRMRNIAGKLANEKLNSFIFEELKRHKISHSYFHRKKKIWLNESASKSNSLNQIKAIKWEKEEKKRIIFFDLTVPIVKKNIDLVVFNNDQCGEINSSEYKSFLKNSNNYLALGELKGGIDPAGADEHWKTANTALSRIRSSFEEQQINVLTFFIGAAIEISMAHEIYDQLTSKKLDKCANLTKDEQLKGICSWIVSL
jgi:hypothetical protein